MLELSNAFKACFLILEKTYLINDIDSVDFSIHLNEN